MPTIDSWTIYDTNYCTEFTWGQCIEWTKIQSLTKTDIKEIWVSIVWNSMSFLLVFVVLWWIVRVLFAKFFWWK